MATRNVVKVFIPESYYHVYSRGWNLTKIFLDEEDYLYFECILARHLSPDPKHDSKGREYTHLYPSIRLNSYCLMGNNFHMLVRQGADERAMTRLMKSVLVAYTSYFNRKYKRRGALFESTYKAVRIENDEQLMHITRYIHLNHAHYTTWRHSSYLDYLSDAARDFIDSAPILELFSSKDAYEQFVTDYAELQRERDCIKQTMSAE